MYKDTSWNTLKNKVEKDLILFKNWFDKKLLTINIKKTQYLPFAMHARGLPNFNSLKIGDSQLLQMANNSIKYLGVILDPHLRWDKHVNSITNKIRCILFKFKELQKFLPRSQLRSVYMALVESHLNYGIIAWGGALNCHIHKLEIMQKKFLKVLIGKNQLYSSELLFKESNVADLRQLFFAKCVLEAYRENNTVVSTTYKTRQTDKKSMHVPKVNTSAAQRSWFFLGPRCFNGLPEHIKSLQKRQFQKELKKYIMSNRQIISIEIDLKNQNLT